jgi:hypothetical protein
MHDAFVAPRYWSRNTVIHSSEHSLITLSLFPHLSPSPPYLYLHLPHRLYLPLRNAANQKGEAQQTKKGKRSKQFAVFWLLIEKSPIDLALFGRNGKNLIKDEI